jgi:alkylhydroperoxidase family enzyme
MTIASPIHQDLVTHLLEGEGLALPSQRQLAFANSGVEEPALKALLEKVALGPTRITDRDFAAVLESGLTEDEVFELVICAAVGQASRQYENALQALAEADEGER